MYVDMRQRMALRDKFRDTLTEAARHRDERQFTVYDPGGLKESGWIGLRTAGHTGGG
jgi:hypothetical protein